jgi:hypothetical protein
LPPAADLTSLSLEGILESPDVLREQVRTCPERRFAVVWSAVRSAFASGEVESADRFARKTSGPSGCRFREAEGGVKCQVMKTAPKPEKLMKKSMLEDFEMIPMAAEKIKSLKRNELLKRRVAYASGRNEYAK